MRERTLFLTGDDVVKLVSVVVHAEARNAVDGNQDMENWCHEFLNRLRDVE